jgi:hypothetical protein
MAQIWIARREILRRQYFTLFSEVPQRDKELRRLRAAMRTSKGEQEPASAKKVPFIA